MFESSDTREEILVELGSRLAAQRLVRRMTQDELAARSGVSKRTIERLEKAEGDPRLSAVVAVCQVLGLVKGFDALVPSVELGPLALAAGERLPRRARKSAKSAGAMKWGDEA